MNDQLWQEAFKKQLIGGTVLMGSLEDSFHTYIQETLKRHSFDQNTEEKVYALMFNAMRAAVKLK